MSNDNTNHKNTLQQELARQRKQWKKDHKALEKQKDDLEYKNIPLKSFSNEEFIDKEVTGTDQNTASAILAIQTKLKELEERYKQLWPEDAVIREFNKKHAVVHIDQTYILTEKENTFGEKDFSLESPASFKAFYEDEVVRCSDGKVRKKADIWLRKSTPPKRRKYTGIIFDPNHEGHVGTNYNIWKGFARNPSQSSPLKYWAHVRDNICSENIDHYKYLRRWLAYIFQYPDEVHTALVLCGSQGVGKNSFVEPLGILLGQHYVLLSSIGELVSNFNYHLKNAVLIHANEALWGGNKKEIGSVKAMITERTCLIESKGKDRIMVKNFKHLILSSNEDWPVHIDADDRRFFVLRVSEAHKEDHPYFAQIQTELEDGGYEGLLYDLLHEDLRGFNPRQLLHSNEAFSIKLRSADSATRYIYEALREGNFNLANDEYEYWQNILSRDAIYDDYRNWCHESGEVEVKKNFFFITFNKYLPSVKTSRPTVQGKRQYSYQLSSLEQTRNDFCKAFKADLSHLFSGQEEHDESL